MIYFVMNKRTSDIKIGFTNRSIEERLREYATIVNPDDLLVLGTREGTQEDERALHAKYSTTRRFGEWFSVSRDLLLESLSLSSPIPRQSQNGLSLTPDYRLLWQGKKLRKMDVLQLCYSYPLVNEMNLEWNSDFDPAPFFALIDFVLDAVSKYRNSRPYDYNLGSLSTPSLFKIIPERDKSGFSDRLNGVFDAIDIRFHARYIGSGGFHGRLARFDLYEKEDCQLLMSISHARNSASIGNTMSVLEQTFKRLFTSDEFCQKYEGKWQRTSYYPGGRSGDESVGWLCDALKDRLPRTPDWIRDRQEPCRNILV